MDFSVLYYLNVLDEAFLQGSSANPGLAETTPGFSSNTETAQ